MSWATFLGRMQDGRWTLPFTSVRERLCGMVARRSMDSVEPDATAQPALTELPTTDAPIGTSLQDIAVAAVPAFAEAELEDGSAEAPRPTVHAETMVSLDELSNFSEFSAIMHRHLGNVCAQTETASGEILQLASSIEQQVHALVDFIGKATSDEAFLQATHAAGAGVDAGMTALARINEQQEKRRRYFQQEVDAVRKSSEEMREALRGIKRISMQTDVLAINTTVAIARSGELAAGMDPLATEIRRLAQQTAALTDGMDSINRRLTVSLAGLLAAQEEQDRKSALELEAAFGNLSKSMAAVVDLQQSMIDKVRVDSGSMAQPLMALCSSVQFQDITRQQVEQVGKSLDAVTQHIVDLSSAAVAGVEPPASSIKSCLEATSSSYVMDRQRSAHGGAEQPQLAAIELF